MPAETLYPHVDGSGRGMDDGDCIHCGVSGSLEGAECPVRMRKLIRRMERWQPYDEHGQPVTQAAYNALVSRLATEGERMETIARLTRERDNLRVDTEVLSDRYAEVRALADAYIDIVNRTARALGIPEVDEAGASPSLHDVPERVVGVVDALRFAAECLDHEWRGIDAGPPLYGDQGVNQAHRRIRQALDAMHDEPTDNDATQDPPGWGVCGKVIHGTERTVGSVTSAHGCMDEPGHDGPCRFDARADGGEVGDV